MNDQTEIETVELINLEHDLKKLEDLPSEASSSSSESWDGSDYGGFWDPDEPEGGLWYNGDDYDGGVYIGGDDW